MLVLPCSSKPTLVPQAPPGSTADVPPEVTAPVIVLPLSYQLQALGPSDDTIDDTPDEARLEELSYS